MPTPMRDVEVLRAACCVAGLDGEITDGERKVLQRLAEKAGVGAMSLEAMVSRARSDRNFFEEQFRIVRADPTEAMASLLSVATADGRISSDERIVLHHFAQRMGMTDEEFDALTAAARRRLDERRIGRDDRPRDGRTTP